MTYPARRPTFVDDETASPEAEPRRGDGETTSLEPSTSCFERGTSRLDTTEQFSEPRTTSPRTKDDVDGSRNVVRGATGDVAATRDDVSRSKDSASGAIDDVSANEDALSRTKNAVLARADAILVRRHALHGAVPSLRATTDRVPPSSHDADGGKAAVLRGENGRLGSRRAVFPRVTRGDAGSAFSLGPSLAVPRYRKSTDVAAGSLVRAVDAGDVASPNRSRAPGVWQARGGLRDVREPCFSPRRRRHAQAAGTPGRAGWLVGCTSASLASPRLAPRLEPRRHVDPSPEIPRARSRSRRDGRRWMSFAGRRAGAEDPRRAAGR